MSELLKKSLHCSLQKKRWLLKKYQTTIKVVGGKWYIENINAKLPPINRRRLSKKYKIKKTKPSKIFVRPMLIGMILSPNFTGTSFKGQTQRHKTTRIIHYIIRIISYILNIETSHVIFLEIINWNQWTMTSSSSVNNTVLHL